MSKKPPQSSGPRRDGRRGATIIDATAIETPPPAEATAAVPGTDGSAAPRVGMAGPEPEAKAASESGATGAGAGEGSAGEAPLGQPVAPSGEPNPKPTAELAAHPEALEVGPLGAPAGPVPGEGASQSGGSGAPLPTGASMADPLAPEPSASAASPVAASSVPLAGARSSESTSAHPEPARKRGLGLGSLLAASVLGGVVGAGLMAAYDMSRGGGDDLQARLAGVEQRVAERPPLAPLEQRIAGIEAALKNAQGALDGARQAAERATATAQQALDRPAPTSTPAAEANAKAIQDLTPRVAAAEGAAKAASDAAKAAADGARSASDAAKAASDSVKALEGRLAEQGRALQQATEGASRAAAAMRRAVAAERVADALRTGAPYPQALDVLRGSGADGARVNAVAPFAAAGAPTAAALAREFRPAAERIALASRTPPAARTTGGEAPQGDWTGGLWRLADRLVTVRPAGEAAPDVVKDALDRVQGALNAGDLPGALQAYEALPEPARKASAEFGERLRTRVAADEAARALAGEAFAGLDPSAR